MKRTASIVALIVLPSLLIAWGGIHLVLRERASVCAAVEGHESCSCGCKELRSHTNRMATEAGVAILLLLILALCGAAAAFANFLPVLQPSCAGLKPGRRRQFRLVPHESTRAGRY